MLARILAGVTSISLLLLAMAAPALAGGWAVITLDELPGQVTSGQPLTIGFVVRQHGQTPMADLAPTITASQPETGQTLTVTAKAEGEVGHYTAELTFPQRGTWHWSIQAFTMEQPMPPLLVSAPATSSPGAGNPWLLLGGIGLVGAAGTSLLWWRTRARWALVLALAAALVGGAGFAAAAGQKPAAAEAGVGLTPAAAGQALFVAKGCVTCHQHRAVKLRPNIDVSFGPDLTQQAYTPAYLRLWLKDPASIKLETKMPNLGLKDAEIEALIAFLVPEQAPSR